MEISIKENDVRLAAGKGMDEFVMLFHDRIMDAIGGELTERTMQQLSADQITLLAYVILRTEVMDGGFIQLIHNGYGPFIFLNPFAKAMNLWGAHDLRNLIYKGRKLFEKYERQLTRDCSDDDFMALYEQYPEFDDLDDAFVVMEEEVTELVAHYIDDHLENFAHIQKEDD